MEQEFLRATDSEGRNDDHAAAGASPVDDIRQLLRRIHRFVPPVSIGRFDDQIVSLRDRLRGVHDRIMGPAQVTGKHQAATLHAQIDDRRTQDMSGAQELQGSRPIQFDCRMQWHRLEELQAALGVPLRIERLCRMVFGKALPVGVVGFFFLQVTRIRQQDAAQVACCGGAEDPAAKTVAHQQWQVAAVVEVGVREYDVVYGRRIDRQRCAIFQPQLLESLEQAAVDQQFAPAAADQGLRSGDRAVGAEESQAQAGLH